MATRRRPKPHRKPSLGPARTSSAVKTWLNKTVDPALDFEVERVTKVRGITRSRVGGKACVTVTANVVIDTVPTGVEVRRCGRDYQARIVGRGRS